MLKNKIARQVSRSPRPNTTGPNDPAENLYVDKTDAPGGTNISNSRQDVDIPCEEDEEQFVVLGISPLFNWYWLNP
jgi:hypothetical protein